MTRTALVTGSNQGLGLAVVRRLCRTLEPGSTVYLTARHEGRGREAVELLRSEGLTPAFHLMDVSDDASVRACADAIAREHGGIDVVISNATSRIARDVPFADQVAVMFNTNNRGTRRVLDAFGPLLNDGARLVVMASSFGSLRELDPRLHPRFDVATMSLDDLDAVTDDYVRAVEEGRAAEEGWPDWINVPSKVAQVAAVKIFERSLGEKAVERDILVNASCPGLVDTGASRPWFSDMSQAQSPDEAAVDVVWLATLPAGTRDPHGELVQHRRVLPWT
jgi:NAD(P)-dependent dehydrogenase (short-subunit alcohol dehydrogenase family)